MNIENGNLATHSMMDPSAEARPSEKLIAYAPKTQIPTQLEHWLRKRQLALDVSDSTKVDINEAKSLGAKYILIDFEAQETNDLGFLRQLRSELPSVKLVLMTANGDPRFLESLTEAGASGVILKRAYVADLALAIQAAGEGRTFVSGLASQRDGSQIPITARERQVLELMANGYSNQAIGEKLNISVKTVEAHRARLFKKLGASNVADAVLLAIRVGLVMP